MLLKTDFNHAPWLVANAENKKQAHIALIMHLLNHVAYQKKNKKLLSPDHGLVYPATTGNVKERLY